ncbi:ATP-binding protein [Tenacibaculum dicentrarchi]|nr:ATP-binding protein [Tenacibaculum dicentrarchi]MCD8421161.1 ATP-binding protein [Tenacibaculum dicentrarchi]MCD8438280.1 ATP-binding protein [Tenacibaculum dicentrarchi]MCD8452692.1 ATP-binding protein [Tenacibaculum dicentrarchi]MCG8828997.1 ATP-binding protein [Tenacibaculum dicentrarchi]
MNLKSIIIKNFRCYKESTKIDFDNLTTLVGKNDIGKSTIMEALEIFFNNQTVKIEQGDANIYSGDTNVEFICEFSNLPKTLSIDTTSTTTLNEEYLLTSDNTLKIKKVFSCGKKTPTCESFIIANHPTENEVDKLLELKEKDLQKIIKTKGLDVKLKGNPQMRKAIWESVVDLKLCEVDIPVSKPKEDSKQIWEQIESHLPIFALFQSDRSSQDSDNEVQDPMKAAISAAISEVQDDIDKIQKKVREKAEEIASNTHDALKTIDSNLANKLEPQFTPPTPAKWNGLFSIKMDTDDGIPLNKRGSGIRRMILVSFFKAEAERRLKSTSKRSIIYALEEPETAQHPNNQKILIDSFKSLSEEDTCQVILTTHSPGLASELPANSIRFIDKDDADKPCIDSGIDVFDKVASVLGVTPDSRVKVLICVEGPTDVQALKSLSEALHSEDNTIINLAKDEKVAFVLMGGSTLKHWVNQQYLKGLGRTEFHLYDNDVRSYADSIKQVNDREDNSFGTLTNKLEIESYLHPTAIKNSYGVEIEVPDMLNEEGKAVPKIFAEAVSPVLKFDKTMGDTKSKLYLANKAFPAMTAELIRERDPGNEVEGWFRKISELMN